MCSWYGFEKSASFWGNVEYVEYVECFGNLWAKIRPVSSENIQHLQPFPRKKHFFQNHTKNTFNTFNIFNMKAERKAFSKNMLLTVVMLNVVVYSLGFTNGVCRFHIQHIQQFPSKKHIFRNHTKNTFNIFNITAERSTLIKASYSCNVECFCLFLGLPNGSVSSKNIQHIKHFPRKKHIL